MGGLRERDCSALVGSPGVPGQVSPPEPQARAAQSGEGTHSGQCARPWTICDSLPFTPSLCPALLSSLHLALALGPTGAYFCIV